MWPFSSPARDLGHESCTKALADVRERFGKLEERVVALEAESVEYRLRMMELVDKVSHRFSERERKRAKVEEEPAARRVRMFPQAGR